MNPTQNYGKITGWLVILSGLLAVACNGLLAAAVRLDFEAFDDPARLFTGFEPIQAEYFRWGMLTDLWGYYLLFIPLVLYAYERMTSPWRRVYALSGLAYALFGAAGAAVLAAAGGDLLRAYPAAGAGEQAALQGDFLLLYRIVNDSVWNLLEMGLFGIFCFGVAPLWRRRNKALYYLTLTLGVAAVLDSLGHTFGWPDGSMIGLNVYLLLAPIWAIWLGSRWVRNAEM